MKGMVSPRDGGCWYCHKDNGDLVFCFEFDTYIHLECIDKRGEEIKRNNEYDPEWEIIAQEFGYG